jgi:DNA-binding NarL/FixJ family response regulator
MIDCLRGNARTCSMKPCASPIRQRKVLHLLAEGKVIKEIGGILHMRTGTVAFHKYRIMEVLGAKNSAELVNAVRNHMVDA